jgi:hypothetical protein
LKRLFVRKPFILVMVILLLAFAGGAWGYMALSSGPSPEEVAESYYTAFFGGEAEKAYQLTTPEFREIVPLEVFREAVRRGPVVRIESVRVASRLKTADDKVVLSVKAWAQSPRGDRTSPMNFKVRVVKTAEGWRIDEPPDTYIGLRIEMAPLMATVSKNGVNFGLKPFLVHTAIEKGTPVLVTNLQVTVENRSGKTLRCDLPAGGTPLTGHIVDLSTGREYRQRKGWMVKGPYRPQWERATPVQPPDKVFLLIPPGGSSTIGLDFEPLDEGLGAVSVTLGPFSFLEEGSDMWDVTFPQVETSVIRFTAKREPNHRSPLSNSE